MTLYVSWWLLPLTITIILHCWFLFGRYQGSYGYAIDLVPLFRLVVALIGSLIAWLIWALLN